MNNSVEESGTIKGQLITGLGLGPEQTIPSDKFCFPGLIFNIKIIMYIKSSQAQMNA